MDVLSIVTFLIILSAVFSYLNVRVLRLPGTIGVMAVAIIVSLIILIAGRADRGIAGTIVSMTESIDFSKILLDVMLGFLLFASALHFDLRRLKAQRKAIFALSTVGVFVSTAVFGFLMYGATSLIGIELPLIYCLAFGALISPTDPIAVASILRKSSIPPRLETIISGESMFNDAVGIILFVTLIDIPDTSTAPFSFARTATLFGQEVIGGLAIGLTAGYIGARLMRSIADFQTILLLSVALVFTISLLAVKVHASVPLAVVAAGLMIGNHEFGRNNRAHAYLVQIWKLLDEVLNTILFVMLGLQLVALPDVAHYWLVGICAIAAILLARLTSVFLPAMVFLRKVRFGNLTILTWAGLRGGISVAMALSLPASPYRETILAATYFIVIFSVIVQGLSLSRVVAAVNLRDNG